MWVVGGGEGVSVFTVRIYVQGIVYGAVSSGCHFLRLFAGENLDCYCRCALDRKHLYLNKFHYIIYTTGKVDPQPFKLSKRREENVANESDVAK